MMKISVLQLISEKANKLITPKKKDIQCIYN